MRRPGLVLAAGLVLMACQGDASGATSPARIVVDGAARHQPIDGFGAAFGSGQFYALANLAAPDRTRILDFMFGRAPGQMALNFVLWNKYGYPEEGGLIPGSHRYFGANDNADPFTIDWSTYRWIGIDGQETEDAIGRREAEMITYMRRLGVTGEHFGGIQGPPWNGNWRDDLGTPPPGTLAEFDPDETVENQLAMHLHFRKYGITFPTIAPFLEPGGGGPQWRISTAKATEVVKRLGRRLEQNGFSGFTLSVASATNVEQSLEYARAILADPEARRFVGAIDYHTYGRALGMARGVPSAEWIQSRRALRDLARSNGLPLRMVEFFSSADLLDRANHILNELEYADARTYAGMWILTFPNQDGEGDVVTYTLDAAGRVASLGPTRFTGVAIGHWSRWVPAGSVRLGVSGGDADVRAQAFRTPDALAVVLVNNATSSRAAAVDLAGGLRAGPLVNGEQTAEGAADVWRPVAATATPDGMALTLPARSVTSLRVPLAGPGTAATPPAPAGAGTAKATATTAAGTTAAPAAPAATPVPAARATTAATTAATTVAVPVPAPVGTREPSPPPAAGAGEAAPAGARGRAGGSGRWALAAAVAVAAAVAARTRGRRS